MPRRRLTTALPGPSALRCALLALVLPLLAGCQKERARIIIDVDNSACPNAGCVTTAQLSVGRDGCLLTRFSATAASGSPVIEAPGLREGDELTLALVLHCDGDNCARCVATQAGVRATAGARITLKTRAATSCVARGRTPPSAVGLGPCNQPDAGPPRDSAPRDSAVPSDRGAPQPDSSRSLNCGQARSCSLACSNINCVLGCQARACFAAAGSITNLLDCALRECSGCVSDFSSCDACIRAKCPKEYTACSNNKC